MKKGTSFTCASSIHTCTVSVEMLVRMQGHSGLGNLYNGCRIVCVSVRACVSVRVTRVQFFLARAYSRMKERKWIKVDGENEVYYQASVHACVNLFLQDVANGTTRLCQCVLSLSMWTCPHVCLLNWVNYNFYSKL